MKVLVVISRFGPHAIGGAESLARLWVERMARRHDVTVATTRARDYQTWTDHEPPGASSVELEDGGGSFRLVRFSARRRSMRRFNAASRLAFRFPTNRRIARWWMRMQGPVSRELDNWLAENAGEFDVVVLFHYLYYTTWTALPHAAGKVLLVPLTHAEPPLALREYNEVFAQATAIATMSETEESLIRQRFGDVTDAPLLRVGTAVEAEDTDVTLVEAENATLADWADRLPVAVREAIAGRRFGLVLGRIAEAKGIRQLSLDLAAASREVDASGGRPLPPVLVAGPMEVDVARLTSSPSLHIEPGTVPGNVARLLRKRAAVTLHPSPYESLNLSALESLAAGTPVLAHMRSEASCEIVAASDCGATWSTPAELAARLREFADRSAEERATVADRAREWLREQHSLEALDERLETALRTVVEGSR